MKFIIHTDGGARGNPGPAAIGVVIEQEDRKIGRWEERKKKFEISKRIGETTNNVAEYTAVIEALNYLKSQISSFDLAQDKNLESGDKENLEIQFFIDSNLIVNQLNGLFKVKEPNLRNFLVKVRLLEQEVGGIVKYSFVPREQNRRADFLVNRALDASLMSP